MYLLLSAKGSQVIIPTQQQDIIYTRNHMTEILIECNSNCFSYPTLNSFARQYLWCLTQFAGIFRRFIVSPSYCITNWNIFSLYQKFLSHYLFAVCIRTELSGDNSGKNRLARANNIIILWHIEMSSSNNKWFRNCLDFSQYKNT